MTEPADEAWLQHLNAATRDAALRGVQLTEADVTALKAEYLRSDDWELVEVTMDDLGREEASDA
jgi:hypothetical protein